MAALRPHLYPNRIGEPSFEWQDNDGVSRDWPQALLALEKRHRVSVTLNQLIERYQKCLEGAC